MKTALIICLFVATVIANYFISAVDHALLILLILDIVAFAAIYKLISSNKLTDDSFEEYLKHLSERSDRSRN